MGHTMNHCIAAYVVLGVFGYPDFVVKIDTGEMGLVETKGQESLEVAFKNRAARMWCENAATLTRERWRYVKVPQKGYQMLQPVEFGDLETFVN